jgi:hypothetical protein
MGVGPREPLALGVRALPELTKLSKDEFQLLNVLSEVIAQEEMMSIIAHLNPKSSGISTANAFLSLVLRPHWIILTPVYLFI